MNLSRSCFRFLSLVFSLLLLLQLLPIVSIAETPSNTFFETPNHINVSFEYIGIANTSYDNYTVINNLDGTVGDIYLSDLSEHMLYMGNRGVLTSMSNSDINGYTEHGYSCHFSLGENLIVTQDARSNTSSQTIRSVSVEYKVTVEEGNTSLYYRRSNFNYVVVLLVAIIISLLVWQIFKSIRIEKDE